MSITRFISFEGSEGCGKSTQIALLKNRLEALHQAVILTREPGGTPLGEAVRDLLKHSPAGIGMCAEAELLLFSASRAELARKVIAPALTRGDWVLSDRYDDSTTVYQGLARGLGTEAVRTINTFARSATQPTLTLVLDLPLRESRQRMENRRQTSKVPDRMEEFPEEFYQQVESGYRELAQREPARVRLIDATGTIEEVSARIWQEVSHVFSL